MPPRDVSWSRRGGAGVRHTGTCPCTLTGTLGGRRSTETCGDRLLLAIGVEMLKGRPGGDIGIHGSISVSRTLIAADVVDELRLVIAPTIAGSGQRLFDRLPPIRLEMIRSTASPTGHLLVDYRVVR